MKTIICDSYQNLCEKAGDIIIRLITQKTDAVLGLATGSTPLGLYDELVSAYEKGRVSFRDVTTFNLDEYIGLPHDHPQSYHHYMETHFFSRIDIDRKNAHVPENDKDHLDENVDRYNRLLDEHPIDLQILGIGSNGHIGFNEPGTPFSNETFVVELDEQTRKDNARFFEHPENVPTQAITMGIKNIMRSKRIILMATGPEKADAIQAMMYGDVSESCPASVLQLHPDVTVILDSQAAAKINR